MHHNPEIDLALRNIEDAIEAGRKATNPLISDWDVLWCSQQGHWVPNPNK